jgi:hypothetical protein
MNKAIIDFSLKEMFDNLKFKNGLLSFVQLLNKFDVDFKIESYKNELKIVLFKKERLQKSDILTYERK